MISTLMAEAAQREGAQVFWQGFPIDP